MPIVKDSLVDTVTCLYSSGCNYHYMPTEGLSGTRNRGIIHLIDDEKDIVAIASSALERDGYQVHSLTDVSELIEDAHTCRDKISMLITDVRMPGGSGFEVARKVRAIKPDVPIILMTAFEVRSLEFDKMFPSLKVDEFLQKPFHVSKLLDAVRKHI